MRVFVLDMDGNPLTPTTPCRARKMLRDKVAKKVWSKFNTFGIQMLIPVGNKTPDGVLGVDYGTKFEGYSVVVGEENLLNVKLDLPKKEIVVKKLIEKKTARISRRRRLRNREPKFSNKSIKGFLAPSQRMLINIRINMVKNLIKLYPIKFIAVEDVCFNHAKYRWGKNFSTIEIGKNMIRRFINSVAKLIEFQGFETKDIREKFGYKKISNKSKNCFESHCCDSLAIASEVIRNRIEPLKDIIVVDKTYLPVRRKIHKSNYAVGGLKKFNSKGTVKGFQKGKKVGYKGIDYILSGIERGKYRLMKILNRKQRITTDKLDFISSQYIISYATSI